MIPPPPTTRGQSGQALLAALGLFIVFSILLAVLLGLLTTVLNSGRALSDEGIYRRSADGSLDVAVGTLRTKSGAEIAAAGSGNFCAGTWPLTVPVDSDNSLTPAASVSCTSLPSGLPSNQRRVRLQATVAGSVWGTAQVLIVDELQVCGVTCETKFSPGHRLTIEDWRLGEG